MSFSPTAGVIVRDLGQAAVKRLSDAWRSAAGRRRTLKVGVDIRPFYEPLTGVGWYLYYLLEELAKRDDVELYLFGDARITDHGPHLHVTLPESARLCTFDLRDKPLSRFSRPATAAAYVAWIELTGCDVFFGANYFLPRLHSAVARRRVITIHDLTYKRFPELLQKETLENLERQMAREIAIADAVICVSESTRRDLLHFYQIDPGRAVTVHSGLGAPAASEPVEGLPARYILFVSTIEPRKNLETLLDAYERLRRSGRYDGSLVVVGKVGWKAESMVRRLRGEGIVHLDYLRASQLATVYERAEVFAFPSIYEGFGFPLLEAMARGIPSVSAHSSSLPEIGGDAALYFDPSDVEGLVSQLDRAIRDRELRDDLAARGRARAAKFRWAIAAEETLAVLRKAAGR
ncbi:MAG TPA: glycosyltransferase family 1 protein [Thermoanaerobaculia bacterium]